MLLAVCTCKLGQSCAAHVLIFDLAVWLCIMQLSCRPKNQGDSSTTTTTHSCCFLLLSPFPATWHYFYSAVCPTTALLQLKAVVDPSNSVLRDWGPTQVAPESRVSVVSHCTWTYVACDSSSNVIR
jgi:hypothetical protein